MRGEPQDLTEAKAERKVDIVRIKELIKTLEKSLKDEEKRRNVEHLFERFSIIDRRSLQERMGTLAGYVDDICGQGTCNVLFRIVGSGMPEIKKILEQIEDPEIREWLHQLNLKYISTYEGAFPPLPNDWYRIIWTTKIDFTHGNIPLVAVTLLKRNGENVYLEMPFPSASRLINHLLKRIVGTKEIDVSQVPEIRQELEEMKRLLESSLKEIKRNEG